jgi:hypothetical protein
MLSLLILFYIILEKQFYFIKDLIKKTFKENNEGIKIGKNS